MNVKSYIVIDKLGVPVDICALSDQGLVNYLDYLSKNDPSLRDVFLSLDRIQRSEPT